MLLTQDFILGDDLSLCFFPSVCVFVCICAGQGLAGVGRAQRVWVLLYPAPLLSLGNIGYGHFIHL